MRKLVICLIGSLLLTGCATTRKSASLTQSDLAGRWHIESAMGKSTTGVRKSPYIVFDNQGKVNGDASVNRFHGGYTLKGDSLQFSRLGMTMMMDSHMEVEQAVVEALNEARTLKLRKGRLLLRDARRKEVMVLVRE